MTFGLRFVDYGFTYSSGDAPALAHLSLDCPAGKVTTVIAPQGAGKTTLLRAAAGLLGEIYHGEITGEVRFANSPSIDSMEHRSAVSPERQSAAFFDGYVQVTLAVETVREELGLPLFAQGVSRVARDLRAVAISRELGIEHLLDRPVTQLSGGEEKLVGIAAALVPDVPIHVLDEPFEQLDIRHLAAVIRAIKRRAHAGKLVLVATSSVDIAINIADQAIAWDAGAWQLIDEPTYENVAGLVTLGESPVMQFLSAHHARGDGVRVFRDAVRRSS